MADLKKLNNDDLENVAGGYGPDGDWKIATACVKEGTFLALRSYPGYDDSNIIDEIYNGCRFSVYPEKWSGDYVWAYYNGNEGWANSNYCFW